MFVNKASIKAHQKEILVLILFFASFTPTLIWMYDRWFADNSYYSHGILVPVVSLFLILKKRRELEKLPHEPSPWGFRLFLAGIILYWLSALLHVYFTSGIAMLIVMAGLVLNFYGAKTFRYILFPLLFLLFMVPLPIIVVSYICFKLKIIAAHLATFILNMIGLPAIQQSSLIKMRHCYVLVEDSCGGLRSLISLTALGCIFAYELKSGLTRKIILFLTALPIATITNACRIVFLASVAEIGGTGYTQGTLHSLSAYLVFAFAFVMLFGVKEVLEKAHG